jgi:succinate dehydrogenase/fumarate reductase flavoprotein subunit
VFGEVAAEEAVRFIGANPGVRADGDQLKDAAALRDRRFTAAGRHIEVTELEYKVRRLITDYVISPKNAFKLNQWLEWSDRFKREIEEEAAVRNGHELSKLFEIDHIVRCADFSARASLMREESRWGGAHRRTDFPEQDDDHFLCHITVHKGTAPGDILVDKEPVKGLDGKEVRG